MGNSKAQRTSKNKVPHLLFRDILRLSAQTNTDKNGNATKKRLFQKLEQLLQEENNKEFNPLVPLIYRNIKAQQKPPLSKQLLAKMKYLTHQAIAIDMENQKILSNVFSLLGDENIKVILLKSAAFSGTLYSHAAPRIGLDLDIMVQPRDLKKAFQILSQIAEPKEAPSQRFYSHHTSFEHTFKVKTTDNAEVIIELHTDFFHQGLFSEIPHAFWTQSIPHPEYEQGNVRMLCPEHNLIHLAIHAFGNLSYTHHNLLDAHELMSQNKIDWALLYTVADTMRSRKALYALLTHTTAIFGTNVSMTPQKSLGLTPIKAATIKIASGLPDKLELPFKGISYRVLQMMIWPIMCDRTQDFFKFQKAYFKKRKHDLLQYKSSKK